MEEEQTQTSSAGGQKPRKATETQIVAALEAANGNIALAAQILNKDGRVYSRRGLEKKIASSPYLTERRKDALEILNDIAELNLARRIRDGDFRASQYWLEHHHPAYMPAAAAPDEPMQVRSVEEIEKELRECGFERVHKPDADAAPKEQQEQPTTP